MERIVIPQDKKNCEIKLNSSEQSSDNKELNFPIMENESIEATPKTLEEKNILTPTNEYDLPIYIIQPVSINKEHLELNQVVTVKEELVELNQEVTIKEEYVETLYSVLEEDEYNTTVWITETENEISSSLNLGNVTNRKKYLRKDIIDVCKGCQKEFKKIKIHLVKTLSCNLFYPTQEYESDETVKLKSQPPRNLENIEASEQVFILENKCRFCVKTFKNIVSHLNQSNKCMIKYSNEELRKHQKLLKKSRQKKSHNKHREERLKKMSKYNKDNKEYLAKYLEENREERLNKMAKYNKDNKEHFSKYLEGNREERLKKMAKYNKDKKAHLAKYHEDNREERLIKMAKYNKDNKEHLANYHKDNREERLKKMSKYHKDNREERLKKMAIYNKNKKELVAVFEMGLMHEVIL